MPNQAPDEALIARNRSASGGVNTFRSPLDIEENEVVELTNGLAPVPGIRKVRPGTSVVASGVTHGPIAAMSEFTPSSFVPELLVVAPGASFPTPAHMKLFKWDGTGSTFTEVGTLTGFTAPTLAVDIVTGLDLNAPGGPAVARITSKQNLPFDYIYAGSSLTLVSGPAIKPSSGMFPIGTSVGRAFGAGRLTTDRGKVFYSDVASWNVTGFSTLQSFTMGGGTRQEIVALKEFRSSDLIVFLSDRIEAIQMNGDPLANLSSTLNTAGLWSRIVIDRSIGCASRRSVQTVGEDLFFVDQYGNVRSLNQTITDNNQGTKTLPISSKIQTYIDRINPSAVDAIVGAAWDRYYVVSLPLDNAVTPSHSFLYDTINGAWFGPWDGPWSRVGNLAVATLVNATSSTDRNPTLYIGGAETSSGKVYRTMSGTGDDSLPIVYQETTKRDSFATLDAKKKPQRIRLYGLPSPGSTLMIESRANGGAFRLVGYQGMSGEAPQLPLTGPIDLSSAGIVEAVKTLELNFQNARDIQHRFTCTCTGDLSILGYTTQAHLKNIDWQVTP